MDFPHVRYFLAVCEELHFGKAAIRCGVAQPTVTNAIKRFESTIGGALFVRRPSIQPTPLALAIKPQLEQIMTLAKQAYEKAERVKARTRRNAIA